MWDGGIGLSSQTRDGLTTGRLAGKGRGIPVPTGTIARAIRAYTPPWEGLAPLTQVLAGLDRPEPFKGAAPMSKFYILHTVSRGVARQEGWSVGSWAAPEDELVLED